MSMYRQMWLAIILSTLLALLGGLLASTLNARSYLNEQLSSKNTDNATALALALSQQNTNPVMIELTVSALFDSGHYELIRVVDPLGKTIAEKSAPASTLTVPAWFVAVLPLNAAPGRAQISSGWNQIGTLTLVSNSQFAYRALWKSVLQLVLALALSGLVGGILAATILRRLHEPLQRVINQANAISERRFVLIDVPDVPELRQLALAMNGTVTRLKSMFTEESQRLEVLRIAANYDPLTGLANRTFFLVQLLDLLDSEEAEGGTLLLVRIASFSALDQRSGTAGVDELLKQSAAVLKQHVVQTHAVAARIGDYDFALLLPVQTDARDMAGKLLASLVEVSVPLTGGGPAAYIGMATLQHGQDLAGLMAQASGALIAAESSGENAIRKAGTETASNADVETARLIRLALDQGRTRLSSLPVINMAGNLIHRECSIDLALSDNSGWQPARQFMHVAEAHHLTLLMDLSTIKLALEKLENNPALPGLAISLSGSSIHGESNSARLLEPLRENPRAANRLWLQLAESDALKQIDSFQHFVAEVRKAGSRAGLKNFGRQFNEADAVHELGLDFLKVDPSFIRGLQYSADNQIFLKGLASVAHKMGLQIYADGVIDRAELAALETVGFDGAAGSVVNNPA